MSKNFLEELNKFAGSAFSSAVEAKDNLMKMIKEHVDNFIKTKDFVSREEFEALKAIVLKDKDSKIEKKKIIKKKTKQENA